MIVSELAQKSTVSADTVRYYTRIGLLQPNKRFDNGYRSYSGADVERLQFIRQAKNLGYTLAEISEILRDAKRGQSPCPKVRDIIGRRIQETKRKVQKLTALQNRMEDALKRWQQLPDGVPDGHCVCHLIASVDDL